MMDARVMACCLSDWDSEVGQDFVKSISQRGAAAAAVAAATVAAAAGHGVCHEFEAAEVGEEEGRPVGAAHHGRRDDCGQGPGACRRRRFSGAPVQGPVVDGALA